jgi:hypothetical protein
MSRERVAAAVMSRQRAAAAVVSRERAPGVSSAVLDRPGGPRDEAQV